ncbi:uncharacterized protein Dana_GF15095 [Drosophila ananassae]|uniref:Cilia- and flagella-associated protein 91 n=1 Tax=Drosophila ananassae TaxID=7217 RepID=A0A0P8ZEL6_DROAN|nr:cilia- and flagella-associated protein 91 [Drosophila ananassae]KPU73123.1 uncharacterized protein Dana_GF15095 [Drosophila ananassae]
MRGRKRSLMRENIMRFLLEERSLAPEKPPTPISSPKKEKEKPKPKPKPTNSRQHHKVDLILSRKTGKPTPQSLSSCLITTSPIIRMAGGANNPAERSTGKLPTTDSQCPLKAPGIQFLMHRETNVSTHEVKMSPSVTPFIKPSPQCTKSKIPDDRPFKDQRTQTLYRESSAQTLAYLPNVLDKKQTLELFSLPSVLPGEGPPGLNEVEILDRARKRWEFKEVLKTNLNILSKDAKKKAIKIQYKSILEAFEWEQWIQREEYIQECQMMRLEIVIKMFDKREKQMHTASKSRIEKACEEIEKRRLADLQKNEIQYNRGMRRLEMTLSKIPRKWEKQSPLEALGSMCSEFYAPLLRHGVDPARRSFVSKTKRKAFDMRIDDLEKQVNMSNLICPFRKLKDWSKPKEPIREYEQNFCNEEHLQTLFEDLKILRTQKKEYKEEPKCLFKRPKPVIQREASVFNLTHFGGLYDRHGYDVLRSDRKKSAMEWDPKGYFLPPQAKTDLMKKERYKQDLENILNSYEGTYIGWVMQFLSDEMSRLQEQRKLHFFCMMAQKERWRREAEEGGLRQKENELRFLYEELFQEINSANNEVATKYINNILDTDAVYETQNQAIISVTHLAKQIDADLERWLESFKLIQNPLTFIPLRMMLKDMLVPDLDAAQRRHESSLIVQHVLEDVLFPGIWEELDPFDIGTTLTSDLIDRLIDNDLYLFSTDSEDDVPRKLSWYEARAIIRKLIRQAVPGKRWMEENERIACTIYTSFLDELFAEIEYRMENPPPVNPNDIAHLHATMSHNRIALTDDIRQNEAIDLTTLMNLPSFSDTEVKKVQLLALIKKIKWDQITKDLKNLDVYQGSDPDEFDIYIKTENINPMHDLKPCLSEVFSITSTLDVAEEEDLQPFRGRRKTNEVDLDSTLYEFDAVISSIELKDTVEEKNIESSESPPKMDEKTSIFVGSTIVQPFVNRDTQASIERRLIRNRPKTIIPSATNSSENLAKTDTSGYSNFSEVAKKKFSVIAPVGIDDRHSVISFSPEKKSQKSDHQLSFIDLDNTQSGQVVSIFQSLKSIIPEQHSDDDLLIRNHERRTINSKSTPNINTNTNLSE